MKKTAVVIYKAISTFLFLLGGSVGAITVFSTFKKVLINFEATGVAENMVYLAAVVAIATALIIIPVFAAIMHEIGMFALEVTLDFIIEKRDR